MIRMEFSKEVMPLNITLTSYLFNTTASTAPKRWTAELLRWIKNLNQLAWDHEISYADRSSKAEQLSIRQSCGEKKTTYERGGRLEGTIHILFQGDKS
jgi:ribonucleotide reductase beta subunit family protein with ferritin-like domain